MLGILLSVALCSAPREAFSSEGPPKGAAVWPRFRGPNGMGIVAAGDWPTEWNGATGRNIAWKTPVPAPGKSSPIVWWNRVFLTGATAERREVLCFERTSGELLWRTTILSTSDAPRPEEFDVMEDTGHAAATPATDGRYVYATFANADIAAVDFNGKVVWTKNLGNPDNFYGRATSLMTYGENVICQFDRSLAPEDGLSELVALKRDTGATAWRTPRPVRSSWSTPVVVDTPSGEQLLTCAEPWVIAYNPATGGEIWRAKGLDGDVAASPVYAQDIAYATSEYARVLAIKTDGAGDVSETHVAWTAEEGMSDAPSPLATARRFFQVHSSGYMTCYNSRSGALLWSRQIPVNVWASPALVGDKVYLTAENGSTLVFALADEWSEPLASQLGEFVYATPAFCDGRIYVRGEQNLYCIAADTQREAD